MSGKRAWVGENINYENIVAVFSFRGAQLFLSILLVLVLLLFFQPRIL